MLFRPHRGLLAEAMREVREFDGTAEGLQAFLGFDFRLVAVEPYGGVDQRIGWDTYIVTARCGNSPGIFVVGFTNGPLASRT